MARAARLVETLPLTALWNERGPLALARVRELAPDEAMAMLARRSTGVVIAAVGEPPRWLRADEVEDAWRAGAWRASEWRSDCGPAVVLLEPRSEA